MKREGLNAKKRLGPLFPYIRHARQIVGIISRKVRHTAPVRYLAYYMPRSFYRVFPHAEGFLPTGRTTPQRWPLPKGRNAPEQAQNAPYRVLRHRPLGLYSETLKSPYRRPWSSIILSYKLIVPRACGKRSTAYRREARESLPYTALFAPIRRRKLCPKVQIGVYFCPKVRYNKRERKVSNQ